MDENLTPRQRLAQVDEAITAVLYGGQSYKLGSRALTRADLAQLRALRDDLAAQAAQEDSGETLIPGVYAAYFEGR